MKIHKTQTHLKIFTISFSDLLLDKVFHVMSTALSKNDIRYLMKKFRFPDDTMAELDTKYHGKDNLKDKIYHAMLFWKSFKGQQATLSELIRILHIVGLDELSEKLRAMKIYSQALRF